MRALITLPLLPRPGLKAFSSTLFVCHFCPSYYSVVLLTSSQRISLVSKSVQRLYIDDRGSHCDITLFLHTFYRNATRETKLHNILSNHTKCFSFCTVFAQFAKRQHVHERKLFPAVQSVLVYRRAQSQSAGFPGKRHHFLLLHPNPNHMIIHTDSDDVYANVCDQLIRLIKQLNSNVFIVCFTWVEGNV